MPLLTELGIFLRGGFLQRYRAYGAKRKSRPGFPQRLWYYSRNLFYCTMARKNCFNALGDPFSADVTGGRKNDLIVVVHARILVYPQG
jgi:hypothetical protein